MIDLAFSKFVVWMLERELQLAQSVPVRNSRYISRVKEDLAKWEGIRDRQEINHAFR